MKVTEQPQGSTSVPPVGPPDVTISATTALIFSEQAPLVPEPGLHDARAVWTHVPSRVGTSVLVYLHGNNNFVTVDATGQSRVPDWATTIDARKGAASKIAAPLSCKFAQLSAPQRPLVLVPEVSTLSLKSFWAREPAGQYTDPARLGSLVSNCKTHLAALKRPDGKSYMSVKRSKVKPPRIYLAGHSGAGLPLEEAAVSAALLPQEDVGADLWLLDCTYWSKVNGFISFCQQWQAANRLSGQEHDAGRFVCIYRGQTPTEEIADKMRTEIARILGVPAPSLLQTHTKDNLEQVKAALQGGGVIFVRTQVEHDNIPTFFIPLLLETAAS